MFLRIYPWKMNFMHVLCKIDGYYCLFCRKTLGEIFKSLPNAMKSLCKFLESLRICGCTWQKRENSDVFALGKLLFPSLNGALHFVKIFRCRLTCVQSFLKVRGEGKSEICFSYFCWLFMFFFPYLYICSDIGNRCRPLIDSQTSVYADVLMRIRILS